MQRSDPARILFCLIVSFTLLVDTAFAGLDSKKAMFIGGTVSSIPASTVAVLSLTNDKNADFHWKKGDWQMSYSSVTSLGYGQHAGRRVGSTIAWGATTLGIMALPILLSKKRRHYLTIEFTDGDGKSQAAIFEIGKDAIRTSLTVLEVRTGKKVEYEDDEARKAGSK